MATTTERPWQVAITDRLGEYADNDEYTHAIVHIPDAEDTDAGEASLLARATTEAEATVAAEDYATRVNGGTVTVITFDKLWDEYKNITGHPAGATEDEPDGELLDPDLEADDPFEAVKPDDTDNLDPDGALFNKRDYDDPALALDRIDEKDVDVLRLDFSGSVKLDRRNPDDVAFMRRLKLGQDVDLRVSAVCSSKKHGYTTGKEGDLDAIVFTGGLKVDSLYVLTPEEL